MEIHFCQKTSEVLFENIGPFPRNAREARGIEIVVPWNTHSPEEEAQHGTLAAGHRSAGSVVSFEGKNEFRKAGEVRTVVAWELGPA